MFASMRSQFAQRGNQGWLWFLFAEERFALRDIFVAGFCIQVLALGMPLASQAIFDKSLGHGSATTLHVIAVAVVIVAVFEIILSLLQARLTAHTAHRLDDALVSKCFTHLLRLPFAYLDSRPPGFWVTVLRDVEAVKQFFTSATIFAVLDLLFIVVFASVVFAYNVVLGLVLLAGVGICFAVSFMSRKQFARHSEAKSESARLFESMLTEGQSGVAAIKSLALEGRYRDAIGQMQQLAHYKAFVFERFSQTTGQINQAIVKALSLAILWAGAWMVLNNRLTMGQLVAVQMIASRVLTPAMRLASLSQQLANMLLAQRRLGDLLNIPLERQEHRTYLPVRHGALECADVGFQYSAHARPVLQNITLNIPPGKFVGIAGASGSGKSTLGSLLQGLLAPQYGKVKLSDTDLQHLDPAQLRTKIGRVLQEPVFFTGTIAENLRAQQPEASVDALVAAATTANIHAFIANLPAGYDTVIGQGGLGLSGGQRQRLALARALLNNPEILILDEPTSALDLESERALQATFKDLRNDRTLIIITHRPSLLFQADQIFVLDQGRLVEHGTHTELLGKAGRYAKLLNHTPPANPDMAKPPRVTGLPLRAGKAA
jgi:subfamily B ATP-binding cassette protein HlyB/CyaB